MIDSGSCIVFLQIQQTIDGKRLRVAVSNRRRPDDWCHGPKRQIWHYCRRNGDLIWITGAWLSRRYWDRAKRPSSRRCRRYDYRCGVTPCLQHPFVSNEEESLVFYDRTASCAAELVAMEWRDGVCLGVEMGVAQEAKHISVEPVLSRLHN